MAGKVVRKTKDKRKKIKVEMPGVASEKVQDTRRKIQGR